VWVLKENRPARAFYERVGFTRLPDSESTFTWAGVPIPDVCYVCGIDDVNRSGVA
jgi:hypothetical protein